MHPSTLPSRKISNSGNEPKPENSLFPAKSSRRTRSFCSSSSTSNSPPNSPLSPNTPLTYSGVPFSWEHQPGIPKHHSPISSDFSKLTVDLLPLPPPAPSSQRFTFDTTKKKNPPDNDGDPFVTALLECSKDQRLDNCWKSNNRKVGKTLSARLTGIYLSSSCKNSCPVSEPTVFLRRSSYDLFRANLP